MSTQTTWGRKALVLLLTVAVLLTLLSLTAMPAYAANNPTLPIPGDVLEIQGGSPEDGIVVFNLGDYDEFLAEVEQGNRYPIIINRPKGDEAGYAVSARIASWHGSDDNGFQIFNSPTGTESEDYCESLTFAPGETSKTIYIGEPYDFGDNTNNSGDLTSYIRLYEFGRTTMDIPAIRLVTSKTVSSGAVYEDNNIVYANVSSVSGFERPGWSKALQVDFQAESSLFEDHKAYCEITSDLQLKLTKGTETLLLSPVEAVGSILSSMTFIIPPNAIGDGKGWKVTSITGIKNAKDSNIVTLGTADMHVSSHTFSYSYDDPVFGAITTDKEEYRGQETIHVTVPVENPEEWGFADDIDYWRNQFGLSCDGGKSFIDASLFSWNAATESIEAAFPAPVNETGSTMTIAIEVYRVYGEYLTMDPTELMMGRGIYGAYKLIDIVPETAAFVPIESFTFTGLPGAVVPADHIGDTYPIQVQVSPANATIQGYTWTSSNTDRAWIEYGTLYLSGEGRVTLTLTMAEAAYRTEYGLPDSDIELTKSYTFIVGDSQARLITDSVSVKSSDAAESVTARFYDNFGNFDADWNGAAFTYDIKNATGTAVTSGNVVRANGVTDVSLFFGGATPKTVSTFENGEYKPAYTITLTASAEGELPASATATAAIYILPPPITLECLTDTANALVGETTTFAYRIGNLLPSYTLNYEASDGSFGVLTETDKVTNPTTGLSILTGGVSYTSPAQANASELKTITVTVQVPGQESQSLTRRINVVDPDAGLINVRFYDGLDGTTIDPEQGDDPGVFYGIRESKIATLIGNYDESSQGAVYEYVNRMIRPQALSVTAPVAWGKMSADVLNPTFNSIIPYALYRDHIGKEVTLSWESVPTTKKFTFTNDNLSGKVFVFHLENTLPEVPVTVSYTTRNGASVQKDVTPYNGYVFLYEPNGIADDVWMLQSSGSGSEVRYALAYPTGLSLSKSIPGYYSAAGYYSAEMLLTTSETPPPYVSSDPGPAFYTRNVTMSGEPTATFSNLYGLRSDAAIRYGAIDRDGKFIEGTGGEVAITNNNAEFQLPFKALYENPGARLLVEYQFDDGKDVEPWAEYYDLQTLDKAFKNRTAIRYGYYTPRVNRLYLTSPKTATVKSLDGQTQSVDITASNKVLRLQSGDVIDVSVATGKREISAATVTLQQYRIGDSMSEPTVTTTAPVTVLEAGSWAFTPNHYATLRFYPAGYMTPGYFAQFVLQVKFTNGTTGSLTICYGMEDDNGATAQNEQRILNILKETDLFPTERMELRVKDADVKGHTANITVKGGYPVEDYRLSFDPKVAAVYDSINVKYASIPSKNPFTWGVERRGDEYIVRGYVYDRGEGMQNLSNPDSRREFDFYFNDIKKNADYSYELKATGSSIPHLIGYLEGKAVITTSGEVRFTWNKGRMYAYNTYQTPQKNFQSGYFDWAIILEGEVRTRMEIQPPDAGGDPAHPFNFNLKEDSFTEIIATTGHNGQDIELGIYAQEEEIRGGAEAEVKQKAVYRPYLANGGPIDKTIEFWTTGDLRLYRGYRIITDDTGMAESAETSIPMWCASYWRRSYDVSGTNNDSLTGYYPQRWTVTVNDGTNTSKASVSASPSAVATSSLLSSAAETLDSQTIAGQMPAAAESFAIFSTLIGTADKIQSVKLTSATVVPLGMPMLDAGISAQGGATDPLSAARYFNFSEGADILTPGSGGIPNSVFSLEATSAEGGITVAAWGVHTNDDFDAVLDTFDETGAIKYATGMTEIAAGVYSGGAWNTISLTDNSLADVTPKTATNGSTGLVVWYQGAVDVSDGDSETDGVQPLVSVDEGRLMFARYNGSVWSNPAALYTPDSEGIADYSAAMAADGSAIVTAVTDSGRIVIIRIASNGNVTLVGHNLTAAALAGLAGDGEASLPTFIRTSLVYNGKTYTLACFDAENIALTLHDLSTEGSVSDTVFSGVPTNTNGEFYLFRDWAKTGTEAVVLMWTGSVTGVDGSGSDAGVAEAVLYASRMLAEAGSGTVLVCAPMTAFSKAGVAYVDSYDAYINGNAFDILAACKDRSVDEDGGIGESGNAHVAAVQATFTNAVLTSADVNDISNLVPGIPADLNVKVKNNGFVAITAITTQINGGSAVTTTANLLPNDEIKVTVPYTPVRDLPDSATYTVTAIFSDGSIATASGAIDLLQTDIAAQILSFTQCESSN